MFLPLGALLAGDPYGSYQQSRLRGQQIDVGDDQQAGDAAFGRALMSLYGSQGPPPTTVPPGQPSQPAQMAAGAMPQGGPMPRGPQVPPASPQPFMGAPQGGPGGMGAQGGQMGTMMLGGPPRPPMPMGAPGGMPQQPPMGSPGPPQGQPGQPGGITWQAAVQAVVQANPNINQNPRALARAVDHFLPIMNQQSQQDWRTQSLMLRGAALDVREEGIRSREGIERERRELEREREYGRTYRFEEGEEGRERRSVRAEEGRQRRAELSAQTRQEIAGMNIEARRELQAALEQGRQQRAQLSASTRNYIAGLSVQARKEIAERLEEGRESRFQRHEAGVQGRFDARQQFQNDRQLAQLKQRREELEVRVRQYGERNRLAEWRAALDAETRRMREIITSAATGGTPMDPKERANLLRQIDEQRDAAIKSLRGGNRDMKTEPGRIEGYPVPPEARGDPDGTTYNNGAYVKRGDMMVPAGEAR